MKCPICKKQSASKMENQAFPFCNERCKLIDLGKWLSQDYRIASKDPLNDESDEEEGLGDGSSMPPLSQDNDSFH